MKPVILLIDDDKTMLNSLMDQLRPPFKANYTIESVQSISEARQILQMLTEQNVGISLIVADWLMPPDRTNNLLIEIHNKYPKTKLVMLSGYADEAAVNHAKENAGLLAFVRKPWDEDELIQVIKNVLEA